MATHSCAAVILLSFVLAVGFLLIILSCALWSNWLPLLVGQSHPVAPHVLNADGLFSALTFVLAPLPNAIFSHCGSDDFAHDSFEPSAAVDLGRFITAVTVVTGFAFPLILAHAEVIRPAACVMSIVGGGLVRHGHCFVLFQAHLLVLSHRSTAQYYCTLSRSDKIRKSFKDIMYCGANGCKSIYTLHIHSSFQRLDMPRIVALKK